MRIVDLDKLCEKFWDGNFMEIHKDDISSIPSAFDGMTNGDVLINLYPNLKYIIRNGRVVTTIGVASSFDLDWWNAPYQKGGE